MTAVLKIADYSKHGALAVPVNSIQKSDQGDYVFVNESGVAKRKNITEGATSGDKTEVTAGLKAGDQVITAGASDLEDGDQVTVLP
jgi:membrane fusion protein (multidrug efflux system)